MSVASLTDNDRPRPGRVLVTGASGFTGQHLLPALRKHGYAVHGTTQARDDREPSHHAVDLLDLDAVRRTVDAVRPDYVVHLAAVSFVAHDDADLMYRTNVVATRHLLQALAEQQEQGLPLRTVLLPSSANVYGNAETDRPIDEDQPVRPANDYAVSKVAMELMASLWTDRLPLTFVRPFNYTGVGQSPQFLIPKIVAAFKARAPQLQLGNLGVARDFSDVRDVVEAYRLLLEASPRGVFNVCSGTAHSLEQVLQLAHEITGFRPSIVSNPALVRSREVLRLLGDNGRLRSALGGWAVRPLRETLQWMLEDAR